MVEIKTVAHEIKEMRIINYLHPDIAMQLLVHHIMCVLLYEVHGFYLCSVGIKYPSIETGSIMCSLVQKLSRSFTTCEEQCKLYRHSKNRNLV
jgi:hypothetical protein